MSTLKVRCTHGPAHTKDLLDSRSVVYYLPLTRSLGQRFLCALPLFQHTTGSVGRPMAGYAHGGVGEREWVKERTGLGREARGFWVCGAGCMGAFRYWRHVAKGSTRHKKPPAGRTPPEGVSATRRLDTNLHGALRSREASPLQRSSCKGYCHTDRPTRKPWGFTLTANLYIGRAANFCQEAQPDRQTACRTPSS
jgi:hypothetical protein